MDDLASRVEALERQMAAMRSEIKAAAHELRDDADFVKPFWSGGADHMSDHMITKASRKVFFWIASAAVAAALIWIGSLGVLFK